jgi:dGTPase
MAIWRELCEAAGWREGPFTTVLRREIVRELIGRSVVDVLTQTEAALTTYAIDSPDKVQDCPVNVVGYSPAFGAKIRDLKKFLFERMYRHYRLVRMQSKAERFISALFQAYMKEPQMLPTETQARLDAFPLARVVADYIAGMTDRYALDEWQKLFDPYGRA